MNILVVLEESVVSWEGEGWWHGLYAAAGLSRFSSPKTVHMLGHLSDVCVQASSNIKQNMPGLECLYGIVTQLNFHE